MAMVYLPGLETLSYELFSTLMVLFSLSFREFPHLLLGVYNCLKRLRSEES